MTHSYTERCECKWNVSENSATILHEDVIKLQSWEDEYSVEFPGWLR